MNSKDRGNIGEAIVLAEAVKRGLTVSQPFGDNARYDLVIDDGESLDRVQVKTVTPKDGRLVIPIVSKGYLGGDYIGQADYIIAVDVNSYKMYKINTDQAKTDFTLRLVAPKNNQISGINMASNYEW